MPSSRLLQVTVLSIGWKKFGWRDVWGLNPQKNRSSQYFCDLGGESLWLKASVNEDGREHGLLLIVDYTPANQKFM